MNVIRKRINNVTQINIDTLYANNTIIQTRINYEYK
nr:MAG TPA: hypothetical protein [Caudoviricetes sp.]